MRISNFGGGRHVVVFFRLCLAILIVLTLAVGGMVLNTEPVQAISISANPVPPVDVPECTPFTIQFTAAGTVCTPPPNPFFWTWGVVPAWITLDPDTGLLTGCAPAGEDGNTYNFWVGVSEFSAFPPCGPHFHAMAVTINITGAAPPCDMVIDPTFYPVAWENVPFSMTLSVTGGVGPFEWSATGLPTGLSVTDNTTGVISGTPALGTCGVYTVTATVTDTGTCCCPPVSRPFILIVDCYANYSFIFYYTTGCDFTVEIGPGLKQDMTKVLIDGSQKATLVGGQSETFTSIPCQGHLVVVDQVVQGSDPQTRFAVIGTNQKMVTDIDNYAYFDYEQEALIETGSSPSGITKPPGTDFYTMGDYFSTTAPSPVDSSNQKGEKFLFREWNLPDGSTDLNRDLVFTVNKAGKVVAEYDTYYLLNIVSDYPSVSESSWELKDSTATYDLALQEVPIPNFWGAIGGVMKPVNASGTHLMTGPATVKIQWSYVYTVPIIIIVVALLVIIGVIVFVLRRKGAGVSAVPATTVAQVAQPPPVDTEVAKTTPAVTAPVEKKALAEAESTEQPNFCPKCGAPVEKDAVFCRKCGKKLVKGDK